MTTATNQKVINAGHVKKLDDSGIVEGYASTFGPPKDLTGDVVRRGAFRKTIAQRGAKVPLMAVHLVHGGDITSAVGVTVELREDEHGLYFRGKFLPDPVSQAFRAKLLGLLQGGITPGASIGYRVIRQGRIGSGTDSANELVELALQEITLTLRAANPRTAITAAKRRPAAKRPAPAARRKPSQVQQDIYTKIRAQVDNHDKPEAPKAPARERAKVMLKAHAKDHKARARAHQRAFEDYLCGKAVSGVSREAFAPTGSLKGVNGLRLPLGLAAKAFGGHYAEAFAGKAVLSIDSPANVSQGEMLVPPEMREAIERLAYTPAVYDLVRIIPAANGSVAVPKLAQSDDEEFGGVSWEWRGEGASKPETEPEFDQDTITCYEVSGYTEVSERCLSRVPGLESFLTSVFRSSMVALFDRVILGGSGIAQPLGVVNTATVRLVPRATAGAVAPADIVELKHAVKPSHRAGARFVMVDAAERALELAIDVSGLPILPLARPANRLAGFPYTSTEACPAIGQAGDCIFGGWMNYAFAQEEQVVVKRSSHVEFRSNKIAIKCFAVVGGRPLHPRAFSILGGPSES